MLNTPKSQTEEIQHSEAFFNINNCIKKCINDVQNDVSKHRIICLFDPPNKLINGDEEQISQVITHLVNNAIKYSPQAKKVEVRTSSENGKVKISVSDHGTGIQSGKLKTLFTRGNTQPTGLQTAAEIIEHHHGQIGVESYVDIGSTFWFTLPG
ncbi:sensor histidine kinase [Mucilaginibacter sp. FT3.2]|uniref:sensor histidine kinase n=1 Tax=Mucilaginibacter sp. FT3.2 TaxID=2723090 RepID=UPI00161F9B87|nr:HAMP domain-containing sensor histidine kinase [Mucilaginibacter sp. FT3.2]MBB6230341.1 signal transduction histidine kinase [Mucilaginibacter sp. FT3.2]